MNDVLTREQRRRCMSRNRSWDTRPELTLRRAIWAAGARYRVRSKLPGRPDIVFCGPKVAVFVDGCFWHGCPIHSKRPGTNRSYWIDKIEGNRRRDVRVTESLKEIGWTVVRVWEHDIKTDLDAAARAVLEIVQCRRGAHLSKTVETD